MSAPTSSLSQRLSQVLFLAAILATAWVYAWKPAVFPRHWFSRTPSGFYHELSDALLSGQLHLHRQPDPRLMALPDPYDPAKNADYRVRDLSYFHGKYYLYLGAAPAVTLFIPLKLLTGGYLTEESAVVVFCVIGFAASLGLFSLLRRQGAPHASPVVLIAAVLALAMANGYYVVLRGTISQHVAIASAFAYSMLGLLAAARALTAPRRAWVWFGLASLAFGAMVASRPNFVYAVAAILPPLVAWWRANRAEPKAIVLAAIAIPLGVIISTLLVCNWVRFGNIFEFGQRFMLGGWDQRHLANSGWTSTGENAWNYLLSPAAYSAYFPFCVAPTWSAVGVLRHDPWLWLAPLAVWALARHATPRPLRVMGLSVGMLALLNLGTLIFLPSGNESAVLTSANTRYVLDFLPGLVLFCAMGLLAADSAWSQARFKRRALASTAAVLALASAVIALSLDLNYFPAESYRGLAQVFNLPAHAVQLLRGPGYGPINLEVVFPAGKTNSYEPLLLTGDSDAADMVYVHYYSPTQIQFGVVTTGLKGPLSEPIAITYGQPCHLEVSLGSLYPPIGHPILSALSEPEVALLKRTVRIQLEGKIVFEAGARFHPSSPRQVRLGVNRDLPGYSSDTFSGHITDLGRAPIVRPDISALPAPVYGSLHMVVKFPVGKTGLKEPLVTTGVQSAGDFVFVYYASDRRICIGVDHWGYGGFLTPWLPIDYSVNHTLEISMGALLPPAGHVLLSQLEPAEASRLRRQVRVVLDREVVLNVEQETYDSSPYDVTPGRNIIGGSSCEYAFTGEIKSVTRLPIPKE